jgi:hypothetical protein
MSASSTGFDWPQAVIVTCWRMEWCYVSTSLPESLGEGAVYDLVVASVAITNGLMHDWATRPMLRAWLGLRSQGRLRLPLKAFSEAKMSNDPAKLAAR